MLELLRAAGRPLGVREIAADTGLHPNTARFHLDGLVDAGLVERTAEERRRPGRPRMVYRADVVGLPAGGRSYRLLAEMLTSMVAGVLPEPGRAAVEAGRAWGGYLTERPAPFESIDAGEAIRRLRTVLAEVGFVPAEVHTEGATVIPLRHCPFREVAQRHSDVICALHLGLMQGVLAELRAPVSADRLEPFVEPSLCLGHLTVTERPPGGRPAWP